MNFDITYAIMLPVIEFLEKTLGSYGWAIIGLTLIVRILVWPLVAASTKSMQAMSQLQPKMKALQDQYKDKPEVFQKKMAEFYAKNKINPLGGCLPMLVQLPILFALFGTFTGPPFQDKAIPVKVNVLASSKASKEAVTRKPTSGSDSPYVSKDGKLCKFVVQPGDTTVILGQTADGQPTENGSNSIDFTINAAQGQAPADFKPEWKIGSDPNRAAISPTGQATFPADGEVTIAATLTNAGQTTAEKIPVKVKVLSKSSSEQAPILGFGGPGEDATKEKKEYSETTVKMVIDGKPLTVAVEPGDLTVVAGKEIQFKLKAVEGTLPPELQANWQVLSDPNAASVDASGKATFPHVGEIVVDAMIPGEAKNDPFYFINNIGKIAKGMELLEPQNWDVLSLIILFGVTMYLSQKLMVAPSADSEQEITVEALVTKGDKGSSETIPVKVKVLAKNSGPNKDTIKEKKDLSSSTVKLMVDGKKVLVAVEPGDLKVVTGKKIQFKLKAVEGTLPAEIQVDWRMQSNSTTSNIDKNGNASFSVDSEQAAVQKQTQQMMPITVTGMFFFIPLPAGVYLYMVFSNVVQSLQTWLLMRSPAPALVDVSEDASNATITLVPKDQEENKGKKATGDSEENTVKITIGEKKQGKKK